MSEPAVNSAAAPGWFGKLPGAGDFATRRLPDEFVQRWDRWLQQGLAHARDEIGPAWLDGYLVAPIRRFWLSEGLIDRGAWAGLVMPSVDGVGRHFPLTLAQPSGSLAVALAACNWFRALDAAARQVLDMDFTIDDFESALTQAAQEGVPGPNEPADEAAHQLAQHLLEGRTGGSASVWWCDDASEQTPFRCFDALPSAADLAAMMAGTA